MLDERELLLRARAWAGMDPDPDAKAEVLDHVINEDLDWLREHFDRPLAFGTAGMRGPLGPGSARMNRAQVCALAKGLADHLDITRAVGPVVVAHDARLESLGLARDVTTVLRRCGRDVVALVGPVATPVAAWMARKMQAPAAVVVTPSHNPVGDAGIKVYGAEGTQIVPPVDARIRAAMDALSHLRGLIEDMPDELVAAEPSGGLGGLTLIADAHRQYEDRVLLRQSGVVAGMVIATTALHGVAGHSVVRLLEEAGHIVHPVESQHEPDGSFPTLTNPNPENPEALQLLLAEAEDFNADLALANDPDGDRLAVAVPEPGAGWRILTGNEVGMLLADHLLTEPGRSLLVTTVVSTPLVDALAAKREAILVRTWTGFKWIAAAIDWAERTRGANPALGFEEALGYSVGDLVRDKDGINAAVTVAAMATRLRDRRRSLLDRLEELQEDFGVWVSTTASISCPLEDATRLVDKLAADPLAAIDGREVTQVIDHREPVSDELLYPELPPTDLVELRAEGARLLVRPSGTEPKLKCYVHLHAPAEADVAAVEWTLRPRAVEVVAAVRTHLGL